MAMWSPSFSGWLATARPLTYVPLVEPRSVMTHAPCGLRADLGVAARHVDVGDGDVVARLAAERDAGACQVDGAVGGRVDQAGTGSLSRLGGLLTGYAGAGEHHGVGGLLRRGLLRHGLRLRGGGSGCLTCSVTGGGCRGSGAGGIGVELIRPHRPRPAGRQRNREQRLRAGPKALARAPGSPGLPSRCRRVPADSPGYRTVHIGRTESILDSYWLRRWSAGIAAPARPNCCAGYAAAAP